MKLPKRSGGARRGAARPAHQRRSRVAQASALAVLAGTLAVLALRYDGAPIRDVELNDGGVWLSNTGQQLAGRLNSQVRELDTAMVTSSTADEIYQHAADVAVYDDGGGGSARALNVIDPLHGVLTPVELTEELTAAAGGGQFAVLQDDGKLWIKPRTSAAEGLNTESGATGTVTDNSALTVTAGGTVLIAQAQKDTVRRWSVDESGAPTEIDPVEMGDDMGDHAVVAAVGDVPVALSNGYLYRPGEEPLEVGEDAVLQQDSDASDQVVWATPSGLFAAALKGGDAHQIASIEGTGAAARPVQLNGCDYGAWNAPGTPNQAAVCGDGDPVMAEITELSEASELVYRRNRDVLVLNDAQNGNAWEVNKDGLVELDLDWNTVDPRLDSPQKQDPDNQAPPPKQNQKPEAKNDEDFGVRRGHAAILPVTLNDVDPDGDILVITKAPSQVGNARLSVVGQGTQIQVDIQGDTPATVSFRYSVSDGHGNPPSEAEVTLRVHDGPTPDKAPFRVVPQVKTELTVADGHKATLNVLGGLADPEGDPLVLTSATSDAGEVGTRPDGTIEFSDDGSGTGAELIRFTVTGGGAKYEGVVNVTVLDERKAPPTVVPDHFSGVVGQAVLLDPLTNDIDPIGEKLRLQSLEPDGSNPAGLSNDGVTGVLRADVPGTYFLSYTALAGNDQESKPGVIRVDISKASSNPRPPIATQDVATVSPGRTALVDVLANDSDPDNDVLVVTGVSVPEGVQDLVKASLINKQFVRIEVSGDLRGQHPEIVYDLSDGTHTVPGKIAVTPSSDAENRAPEAYDDQVVARAGTIIDVPVLQNDDDPDGDRLTVSQPDLFDADERRTVSGSKVPIVADGDSIRVMVPDDGTRVLQVGYGVRDPDGRIDGAVLVLNIKDDDPEDNAAPTPRPVEERTVIGQRVRVPVGGFGADPDGDPVVFTSVEQPPALGRIVASGTGWFEYEPYGGGEFTGTDEFRVKVTDPYGAFGVVDVRLGVAPRAVTNQAPAALDDRLVVKPGITVNYPVTINDSDPDGDELALEDGSLLGPAGVEAEIVDGAIQVTSPEPGPGGSTSLSFQYTVSDGLGLTSSAVFTLVSDEDAPDHAPIANDDVVTADQMRGKSTGDTVDVDVLDNDGDLDGSRDALTLAAYDSKQAAAVDRKLRVTLTPDSQVIPYKITDQTDQTSFGFVFVAGTESMPPALDVTKVPLTITSGQTEEIDLADVIVVRSGHTAKIGAPDDVEKSRGSYRKTGSGSFEFTAEKNYHGPASVTMVVYDGDSLNDSKGLASQITIPIDVLPAGNVAPEVRNAAVTLYAGGDAVKLDLTRLASDPNVEDELSYEVSGEPEGVQAEASGDELVLSAADGTDSGAHELTLTVDDGHGGTADARLDVRVIGADGPPMRLKELTYPDGSVGEKFTIDTRTAVLQPDPYPSGDKEVTVVSVAGGDASGTATKDGGSTIAITPKDAGEMVVSYTLTDGGEDTVRTADGRIVVTVADVPDAPGKPSADESGPTSIRLSWSTPDDNGSPIKGYQVKWSGGDQACTLSPCLIDGLNPGDSYSFQVQAENGEGWGEWSPSSASITPDEVPGLMQPPRVDSPFTERSTQLHLTWDAPDNTGSEITTYRLESRPATTTKTVSGTTHELTWPGLKNGTQYQFRIQAENDKGPGEWSALSGVDWPFTMPQAPNPPTMQASQNDGASGGYAQVTWEGLIGTDATGGDAITGYTVYLFRDGAQVASHNAGPSERTWTFEGQENGHTYAATVSATNRAGEGPQSTSSPGSYAWDASSAPTNVRKTSDCPSSQCSASTSSYVGEVSFSTPADNGGPDVTSYRWSTSDGASGSANAPTTAEGAPATIVVQFRTATPNQTVTLVPVTSVQGTPTDGASGSSPGEFDPYALPLTPGITEQSSGLYMEARVGFACSGTNNGRPIDGYERPRQDSGGSASGCSVGWKPIEGGTTKCATARVHTAAGWSGTSGLACGTAAARTLAVQYQVTSAKSNCPDTCYNIGYRVSGYLPGTYTAEWWPHGFSSSYDICNSSGYGYGRTFSVGSDGRANQIENWYMASNCKPGGGTNSVRADGITGSAGLP